MGPVKSLICSVIDDGGQISVWTLISSSFQARYCIDHHSPSPETWPLFLSLFTMFVNRAWIKVKINRFWEALVPGATEKYRGSPMGLHGYRENAS